MTKPSGKSGFTLVEVMLALTISSLILTAAYGTFRISMDVSKRASARREALENCRSALGVICRDLAGAFLSSTEKWSLFVGEDAQSGDLNVDTLAFTAVVNSPERSGERTSDYTEVEYYIDTDPETPEEWLVRRYDCRPDEDLREGGITSLAGYQVASLDVWYFKGGDWGVDWDSQKELPTAVRVEVSALIDPQKGLVPSNLVTLSSIVWLPHSQV
jgi:general secretion pathway protein J